MLSSQFNEFVKLDLSRDRIGRAQRLQKFDIVKDVEKADANDERFQLTYDYLRWFYLKKLMLSMMTTSSDEKKQLWEKNGFLKTDFKFKICSRVFQVKKDKALCKSVTEYKKLESQQNLPTGFSKEQSYVSLQQLDTPKDLSPSTVLPFDECIPKSSINSLSIINV